MSDAPERIWLLAAEGADCGEFLSCWGIRLFDNDTEYVRADIHDAALARVEALENLLSEIAKMHKMDPVVKGRLWTRDLGELLDRLCVEFPDATLAEIDNRKHRPPMTPNAVYDAWADAAWQDARNKP